MKRFLRWCTVGLVAAALAYSAPARADLSFGYEARYVGLGGAGLAVIDNPTQAGLINPAALSLRPAAFGMQWPNIGLRWRGAGIGDAFDQLASGSLSMTEAVDLARDLGTEPTRIEANLGLGFALSTLDVRARALGNVAIRPSALFTSWAISGQEPGAWLQSSAAASDLRAEFNGVTTAADANAALGRVGDKLGAHLVGAATVSPSIGFGMKLPNGLLDSSRIGDVRVGVRVKPTRVYYSHWVVKPTAQLTAEDVNPNGGLNDSAWGKMKLQGQAAIELGGKDSLEETSFGMDFGLLWQPAYIPYTTIALTVDNLIEPSFRIPAGADASIVPGAGDKLMPRTVNLGAAMTIPGGLLLAADLLDITGANSANPNGEAQFRIGAEFRPSLPVLRWFAVRAGYNSATGMAAGLSLGSFGIAYAERSPLVASQTFNF